MKSRYKIDAKSMPEKVMQKVWNMIPNASKMGAKINLKSEKYQKKRYPKIDAEI